MKHTDPMSDRPIYVASCSFGKDSIATIILAIQHNEPLDKVVFSEVMFDHKRGISGEIPEHIKWIYDDAIPKLRNMGVSVDVVKSEKDYCYFFKKRRISGPYKGMFYGFPMGRRMCHINSVCKVAPIKKYLSEIAGGSMYVKSRIIQYVGIAADEHVRLSKLGGNKISLLAKYGYTEDMAKQLCMDYKLLSPIYEITTRGGCWFCPNCRLQYFINLRRVHPKLWQELVELSLTPNLCAYGFKYKMTVQELEKKMDAKEQQYTLF